MPRSDSRARLLDAAERLFAEHGIATVSDRKVAEAAGNSNNSAVAYYFGSRSGLLGALVDRHVTALEPLRAELLRSSTTLLGDVRAFVLPVTSAFAALPAPSWRARFLNQATHDPMASDVMRRSAGSAPVAAEVFAAIMARLEDLPFPVLTARAGLMTYLVAAACAQAEQRIGADADPAAWHELGAHLCDALAGMLLAPVTDFAV